MVRLHIGLLLGIGLTLPNIILNSVQILIIPDEYRGRVSTLLQAISVVLIPLSNFLGGIIADIFGANYVFLFCGLWQFLVVLICIKIAKFLIYKLQKRKRHCDGNDLRNISLVSHTKNLLIIGGFSL